ncbi:MAG: hypothetical protein ABI640_18890 [Gammaproteobacteria bacterium]
MLKLLKRWLGWDADSALFDFSDLRPRQPPAQRTLGAGTTPPPAVKQQPAPPAQRRDKSKERNPRDVLDNPRLTLDKPADDGFDPYNTGAFNRSTSWERIGRQKKR